MSIHLARRLALVAAVLGLARDGAASTNILGEPLEDCSTSGMALTGFTRTGKCVEQDDDAGSHHICIDLSSTTGGNFCTVTGQDNWCSSQMDCVGGSGQCPVEDWCVCQWAFAMYIQQAGGCDKIQEIECAAVNQKAVEAYEASTEQQHADALACLRTKCGITSAS